MAAPDWMFSSDRILERSKRNETGTTSASASDEDSSTADEYGDKAYLTTPTHRGLVRQLSQSQIVLENLEKLIQESSEICGGSVATDVEDSTGSEESGLDSLEDEKLIPNDLMNIHGQPLSTKEFERKSSRRQKDNHLRKKKSTKSEREKKSQKKKTAHHRSCHQKNSKDQTTVGLTDQRQKESSLSLGGSCHSHRTTKKSKDCGAKIKLSQFSNEESTHSRSSRAHSLLKCSQKSELTMDSDGLISIDGESKHKAEMKPCLDEKPKNSKSDSYNHSISKTEKKKSDDSRKSLRSKLGERSKETSEQKTRTELNIDDSSKHGAGKQRKLKMNASKVTLKEEKTKVGSKTQTDISSSNHKQSRNGNSKEKSSLNLKKSKNCLINDELDGDETHNLSLMNDSLVLPSSHTNRFMETKRQILGSNKEKTSPTSGNDIIVDSSSLELSRNSVKKSLAKIDFDSSCHEREAMTSKIKAREKQPIPEEKESSISPAVSEVSQRKFDFLNLNPFRGDKLDEDKFLEAIKKEPELCKTTFLFDALKEELYPLHIVTVLNASVKCVKACYNAHPRAFDYTISMGGPVHLACYFASLEVVKWFAKKECGALSHSNSLGQTPLHIASESSTNPDIVIFLTAKYPDAGKAVDDSGSTPLHLACRAKSPKLEIVEDLTEVCPEAGTIRDKGGQTPLLDAIELNVDPAILLDLIVSNPKSAEIPNRNGTSALQKAIEKGYGVPVLNQMISAYPEALTLKDCIWRIPLHVAVEKDAPLDVIQLLANRNPHTVEFENGRNEIAFALAQRLGRSEAIIEFLNPYEEVYDKTIC
jgi:hypothetical protein